MRERKRWKLFARFGIFGRIYLFGLSLLVAMLIGIGIVLVTVVGPAEEKESIRIGSWIARQIALEPNASRQMQLLESLRGEALLALSLYAPDGRILATNAKPPASILDPGIMERLGTKSAALIEGGTRLAVRIGNDPHPPVAIVELLAPNSFVLNLWANLAMLVTVALVAWPIARSLSVPLRRLGAAMAAFGHGDMKIRANESGSDEVAELARTFNGMAERIAGLLRAERLLIAGVAHELRTPLQRLRLALELASDMENEPLQQRCELESLSEDLSDLERIVDDVLTVARLAGARTSAGRELLERRTRISAVLLLEDCVARFEAAHDERMVNLLIEGALPELHVEPRLVSRAIANLLENAHLHSAADRSIELHASASAAALIIEVRDRGEGIAPEHLQQIFTPFYRVDSARARASGGAGLGLTIVQAVIEGYGGRVVVDSTVGVGSCFRITLPAADQPILESARAGEAY